jgi:hypothetical protein
MSERRGHQLQLLTGGHKRPEWTLDERTKRLGRRGVAEVRETLRRARPPQPIEPAHERKAS